jgi:DUF2971 family protein
VAAIKSYAKPAELYRYRSLKKCDRELDAIEQKFLYCSSFNKLNDPMEGMFRSNPRLRLHDNYSAVIDSILQNKTNTGICSFSEVKDNAPMWAHYADGFTGICIAYNFSKLLDAIEQDAAFVRVFYQENVPTASQSGPEEVKMILSYKNYGWRYEREWRMFGSLGQVPYANECVSKKISECKQPMKFADKLLETLRRKGYRLFFWVIEHKWRERNEPSKVVSKREISALRKYARKTHGKVKIFSRENAKAEERGTAFHRFVSGIIR